MPYTVRITENPEGGPSTNYWRYNWYVLKDENDRYPAKEGKTDYLFWAKRNAKLAVRKLEQIDKRRAKNTSNKEFVYEKGRLVPKK